MIASIAKHILCQSNLHPEVYPFQNNFYLCSIESGNVYDDVPDQYSCQKQDNMKVLKNSFVVQST